MLIKLENGLPTTELISEYELFNTYKNVSFPSPLTSEDLISYGYGIYEEAVQPEIGTTEKILKGDVIQDSRGVWLTQWKVVPMTLFEIQQSIVVPQEVTMRQACLALENAGLLDDVEAIVATLPRAYQIEWQRASVVLRDNALVEMVRQQNSMTEAQIDDLFVLAATL